MSFAIIPRLAVLLLVITSSNFCQTLKVPNREDFLRMEETCADVLDVSADLRGQIRQHRYPDTPESHRFTYCTAVLFLNYRPDVGLDVDLMYAISEVRFGQREEDRRQFQAVKEACYERNGAYEEGLSRFERVYRMYLCYADRYERFFRSYEDKKSDL